MVTIKADQAKVDQIRRQFQRLETDVQDRIIKNVLAKEAKVVERKMKELAPKSTTGVTGNRLASRNHPPGYLKASIGIIKSRKGSYPTVWVRPRFKGKWDPWYKHFPMAGTKNYDKAQPNPFVDRAWDATQAQVRSNIQRNLERLLQQQINRLK